MNATRAEVEPTYSGNVESIFDRILLIESCLAGVRPFASPSPGGVHVQSGQVYILRDIDDNAWEDGNSWLVIGSDNPGFLHSRWSNEDRPRKKTWVGDYRGHEFRLVAYYNYSEQPTQRPSWDRHLLTSIYQEQSFWFSIFWQRLEISRHLEDINSTTHDLILGTCEGRDDKALKMVFKMVFKFVSELEELGATVTRYVSSQKKNSSLTERDSDLMEGIRAAIWCDYGLAKGISCVPEGQDDLNELDFLTDKLLDECELHTEDMLNVLMRNRSGS